MLADRRPGAVRVAAGGAAGGLRPAIDIDRVGEGPAVVARLDVSRARHNGAVAAGIGVFPRHRRTRGAAFERVHLGGIGTPLVLVVERCANPVTDQTAEETANGRAGQPVPPPATAAPRSAPVPAPSKVPVFSRGPGPEPSGLPAQAASERPIAAMATYFKADIETPENRPSRQNTPAPWSGTCSLSRREDWGKKEICSRD